MQIIGIVGFSFILIEMGTEALSISFLLIISGLFVYWFYGRIRTNREYALLHLVERITAKELTTYSLETELKEIIRERDEIVKDRFDHIIEQSVVLDIESSISAEEFFKLVAQEMSARVKVEPALILQTLADRERQSSTVIGGNLAIPHLVIEGENTFDVLIARCKEGIVFSELEPNVIATFVILGTRDERNFHLYSLAAIAQIVQNPNFEKRWMAAKSKEALRDIVLLGKRKRRSD